MNDVELWRHQVDTLGDIAEVIVGDMTKDDTTAGMAARQLAAAPPSFALAGLSMGGYTAFEIMRRAPQRVRKLALLDTSARADLPERTQIRERLIALVEKGKYKDVVEETLPTAIHPSLMNGPVAKSYRDQAERTGPETFIRQQRAIMSRPDSRKDLSNIRCPTLVLCGRQDVATPVELHQEIAAGIKGSVLVLIEESGHLPPMERPHAVSAALRYWLLA